MTGRLWVVGDSWCDPWFEGAWAFGWPQLVARRLGLGLVNSGSGGAGYVRVNDVRTSFPIEVAQGAGAGSTVAAVWGSVNDQDADPDEVHAAAALTYEQIRLACPGAPLLVFGPQYWADPPPPRLIPVRDAVRAAALDAGAAFVDPLLWFQGRPDLLTASLHPSAGGHELLADRVAPEVAAALLGLPGLDGAPSTGGYPMPWEFELPAATDLAPSIVCGA